MVRGAGFDNDIGNLTNMETPEMNDPLMPELHIGNLTAKVPIIQGGMGVGISLSGLSSAVADQGGIGVISSVGIGVLEISTKTHGRKTAIKGLRQEILKAKAKTDGIIGVNIMVALTDHEEHLLTSLDAGADVIFMGAGLPLKIPQFLGPDRMTEENIRIVPIVSSARAAGLICRTWMKSGCIPDAVVVEGPMAGGHLGFKKEQINDPLYSLESLVSETILSVQPFEQQSGKAIPVIAAGGVYTGEDIHRFIQMGASGVQMATRFVATHECDADMRFKQSFLHARKEDLMIIDSPVGLPGRAIRNPYLDDVSAGGRKPFTCPWQCLRTCNFKEAPYCIARALTQAKHGNLEDGFVFAGANAWRVDRIVSVEELMQSLIREYETVAEKEIAVA
jgi:nitronate monooxygenase